MPNWVSNTVYFKNDKDMHDVLSKYITIDEDGESRFDFNKIIPISSDLEITSGSNSWEAPNKMFPTERKLKFQKEKLEPLLSPLYNDTITQAEFVDKASEVLLSDDFNTRLILKEYREEYGKFDDEVVSTNPLKGYFNLRRHGYTDWYEANCELWGTKWGASDTYINDLGNSISFQTAWSCPHPIMEKLSEEFDIVYSWKDEDTGSNYGLVKTDDGVPTVVISDNGDKTLTQRLVEALTLDGYDDGDDIVTYLAEWGEPYDTEDTQKEILEYFEEIYPIIKETINWNKVGV